MALSKATIIFNYRKALEQASKLEDAAAKYQNLADGAFENTLNTISADWEGDNASLYRQKGEQLREKMTGTAGSLKAAAATIRVIAKNIYDAEMRNWEIAHRRTYK